jgi:hypothetical protein
VPEPQEEAVVELATPAGSRADANSYPSLMNEGCYAAGEIIEEREKLSFVCP